MAPTGPHLHLVLGLTLTRGMNSPLPLLCPADAILVSALLLADVTVNV